VGGSVRDLLLGRKPKDFDVVTNARPREIRRLFRNSRIIGRRFRLVHVMFAGEIVEVATFRASPEPPEVPDGWEEAEGGGGEHEEIAPNGGPVDENNVYGTPAEDALRRDFTVNALLYDIADFSVIDYVHGVEDLEAGILRTIGEPDRRFVEDPVRMIRALEYQVRLGFDLEPELEASIDRNRRLILKAAPARLAYELLETLKSGHSREICASWRRHGILDLVFPEAAAAGRALAPVLAAVDGRIARESYPDDATLLGVSFLPAFVRILGGVRSETGKIDNPALLGALDELLAAPSLRLHLSNRNHHLLKQGLFTLSKMLKAPERGRQVTRLARQDYFPVAWQLYTLAVESKLLPRAPWAAWRKAVQRLEAGESLQAPEKHRPRRRRPRRRRRA